MLILFINLSEIKTAPRGIYPEVIPFAEVIISGIMPNSSCEQKKCPSLPNPVTTSSEMYRMSCFLHISQKRLI